MDCEDVMEHDGKPKEVKDGTERIREESGIDMPFSM
jgi:hypothetical protein